MFLHVDPLLLSTTILNDKCMKVKQLEADNWLFNILYRF